MKLVDRALRVGVVAATVALPIAATVGSWRGKPRGFRSLEFENTVYSQAGEDGILQRLFEVIPPTRRFAVEFGASESSHLSNVHALVVRHGWSALLIEGDEERARRLKARYLGFSSVRAVQSWVYPANVELLFEENDVPRDLDLLVIDIDSNDYYVWRAIREFRPKVVVIEYNGLFAPPQKMVIRFDPRTYWNERDFHFGASIQSLYELGQSKGYELVAANFRGINLFFVDRPLYPRLGIRDNSPATLFRPYNFSVPYAPEALASGAAPAPSEDLVLPAGAIRKRFRFDR